MKRVFCFIAILAFLTTLNSGIRSDNSVYNERTNFHEIWHWKKKIWRACQYGGDAEDGGNISTYATAKASQSSGGHNLNAYASLHQNTRTQT